MATPVTKTPTNEELLAIIAGLQAQLATASQRKLTLKVGDKGTVNIMGLRKFPIALYPTEIKSIFAMKAEIETFIEQNKGKLSMSKSAG